MLCYSVSKGVITFSVWYGVEKFLEGCQIFLLCLIGLSKFAEQH